MHVDPTAGAVDNGMDVVVSKAVVVILTSGGRVTPPHGLPVEVQRSLIRSKCYSVILFILIALLIKTTLREKKEVYHIVNDSTNRSSN